VDVLLVVSSMPAVPSPSALPLDPTIDPSSTSCCSLLLPFGFDVPFADAFFADPSEAAFRSLSGSHVHSGSFDGSASARPCLSAQAAVAEWALKQGVQCGRAASKRGEGKGSSFSRSS
jgi:hypothetical protein